VERAAFFRPSQPVKNGHFSRGKGKRRHSEIEPPEWSHEFRAKVSFRAPLGPWIATSPLEMSFTL